MKKTVVTRILAMFLATVMAVLALPLGVFADALEEAIHSHSEQAQPNGSADTEIVELDPTVIPITTAEEFNSIRNDLNGTYILVQDIDLSKYTQWEPIGTVENPFKGNLYGNGHTVSGMTITRYPDTGAVGLFGCNEGVILDVEAAGKIEMNVPNAGTAYVGGIVGWNKGTVVNCVDNVTMDKVYISPTSFTA